MDGDVDPSAPVPADIHELLREMAAAQPPAEYFAVPDGYMGRSQDRGSLVWQNQNLQRGKSVNWS
jgi:hypothetical protein